MQNLAQRIADGRLPNCVITAVIASNDTCAGIERAKALGLPCQVVRRKDYEKGAAGVEAFSDVVFGHAKGAQADLICLTGFLSLLPIPDDYDGRILNIHPSLLPAFGGKGMHGQHVHQAVIDHGCKVSGCTVHLADQTYDTGPILIQKTCVVHPNDTAQTLAKRVFELECEAYPEAIQTFLA